MAYIKIVDDPDLAWGLYLAEPYTRSLEKFHFFFSEEALNFYASVPLLM